MLAAESRFFTYGGPVTTLSIGLYSKDEGEITYLTVDNTGGSLVRFEISIEAGI